MSPWSRFSFIFKSKANRVLDRAENPNETLDYSYNRQVEMLAKMRRGVAEVAAARKRIEMQATDLQKKADTLSAQAEKALRMDREDLAREALTRKAAMVPQLNDLRTQHEELKSEEEKLVLAIRTMQTRVEQFRIQKETTKAKYTAAQAQVAIGESFAGLSGEMSDIGHAIQRAEDKTAALRARGSAIDELLESGALDDFTGTTKDSLTRELDAISAAASVEAELASLKALSAPARERRELR